MGGDSDPETCQIGHPFFCNVRASNLDRDPQLIKSSETSGGERLSASEDEGPKEGMSAYHNGRSVEKERANTIPRDLDSDPQLSQSKASEASGIVRLGPCEGEPRGGPMI